MRRLAAGVLTSLALACGDNLRGAGAPLATSDELFVIAHPDDDLLLMQPDLLGALRRGASVTTVYVTAGNGESGDHEVAERRYEGVKAAYGYALGHSNWQCGVVAIAGHAAEHCRAGTTSLVFLGYPDGGKEGEYPSSLLRLWQGQVASATTIAVHPTRYDRPGLVRTLAEIVRVTTPRTVRTLEVSSSHGRDHPDHQAVGALTVLALAAANAHPDLLAYRGYAIADEPPNNQNALFEATFEMIARYAACATDCAACGDACTKVPPAHETWLLRRYAIGFRHGAAGQLRHGDLCVNDALELVSCSAAPPWTLDGSGELHVRHRCLTVDGTSTLALTTCIGGAERRFVLDDEGHLLSGMAPPFDQPGDGFLSCLGVIDARLALVRCGSTTAPTWELATMTTTTTSRADLGITATGRAIRIGDISGDRKADLCTIDGGLLCARGDGAGGFAAAVRIDASSDPLTVEPTSLVLGDVDGDRRVDACGRDAMGLVCATAASGFAAARWSDAFSEAVAVASTNLSLEAIDGDGDGTAEICGVERSGVVCVKKGMTSAPSRSAWPPQGARVWLADLDGDSMTDWCTAGSRDLECGVEAHRELTTDGTAWDYADRGVVDLVPMNTALLAFGDIDGDRRADLCVAENGRIVCARSQATRFGPRAVAIASVPFDGPAALWLGDLDGDGRMDPCTDLGATIVCAVQP